VSEQKQIKTNLCEFHVQTVAEEEKVPDKKTGQTLEYLGNGIEM